MRFTMRAQDTLHAVVDIHLPSGSAEGSGSHMEQKSPSLN